MCRVFSEALFYELEDLVCSVWAPYPILVLTGCFVDLLFVCKSTQSNSEIKERRNGTIQFLRKEI